MRYYYLLFFILLFSTQSFSQPVLSGTQEVCPGDQETYSILNGFYFSLLDFNELLTDDSLTIRPIDKQQDITVTGGTIVSYTTADGGTTAVNSNFVGLDIDLSNNPVQACIIDAIDDGLSIEQLNACIASINNIQENTITSITVQWDTSLDQTCDGNIGFSSRVRREFCDACDPNDSGCPASGEICGITFSDPSLSVNADLNICIGAQPPINIGGNGGCLNTNSNYTAVLEQDARQQSNVTYNWYNDGVLVGTSTTETITLNNTYGPNGRAELCVEAVSCSNSATTQTCKFIYPPLSNTALSGPSCYAPGASAHGLIVNGNMTSISEVKLNNNVITNYYFNGSDEIDFYAPSTVAPNNSLIVTGIDECGGSKTMYYTFSTSHNCSGQGGGGCSWCLTQPDEEPETGNAFTTSDHEDINYDTNQPLEAIQTSGTTISSTNISDQHATSISIYPNPVSEVLTVKTNQSIISATVFNTSGKMLANYENIQSGGANYNINSNNFRPGIYYLQIVLQDGEVIGKSFIKR